MELSHGRNRGWILGRVGAVRSLGLVIGTGVVWLCMKLLGQGYSVTFASAAVLLVIAALVSFLLPRVPGDHRRGEGSGKGPTLRQRFVARKTYRLYYALAVVFGARKQIFLTFAPWLLVSGFNQRAPQLATAMAVSAVIGLAAKPFFGRMIDRFGERTVITADGLILLLLCAGYATVPYILPFSPALLLLYVFYVSDELLFSLSMARTTYLSRIILSREEMVPTMGLAGTMDHVVSMTVPVGAGLIWVAWGSWAVFAIAGLIAIIIVMLARRIPPHEPAAEADAIAQ
ncbi:MFS transporter [Candidatus Fermentibacterales bacterium]|nr:MFS transporter [Candidatus Fermentibacterales bacterium]